MDALKYVTLCNLVYSDDTNAMLALGYTSARVINIDHEYVCVLDSEKEICIVFRGSNDIPDWFKNFQAFSSHDACLGELHHGFLYGYRSIEFALILAIRDGLKNLSNKEIIFTGHSRGGALAQVAAYAYSNLHRTYVKFISFGSPRVWKESFQEAFLRSQVEGIRIENAKDPVVATPREYAGWKSVGYTWKLKSNLFKWLWFGNVKDHLIETYVKNVKKTWK